MLGGHESRTGKKLDMGDNVVITRRVELTFSTALLHTELLVMEIL